MSSKRKNRKRTLFLRQLHTLARQMIFGTLSQTFRSCGQPSCRCHHGGPKHGPYWQISYHGEAGKTTGYHVPHVLARQVQEAVTAWQQFQAIARELAELNRERLWGRSQRNR